VDFILVVIVAALVVGFAVSLVRRLFARVTVYEFQRGLRYDRGRFEGVVPPGQYRFLKHRSSIAKIDVRPRVVTVPGQEVITSDGVSVRLSLLAEYEVAKTEIDDILAERDSIGATLTELTRDDAARLGLQLARVELKDLMFPGELKKTFAQVVTVRKEGLASLERARGETAALRSLANAARVMEGNPSLMHVRLLQELGNSSGNTIVVGFPTAATPLPLRPGGGTVEALEPAEDE
jgi:regulator of protease activity HflC (stomatin/prohibitin superfamily)